MIRRTINPHIKVLDAKAGLVEYVASDETVDCCREIIRADGWRFDEFKKNAPFVDSHNYQSIDCLLGKVVEFRVTDRKLVETVQWAIDVPTNTLAQKGFAMTEAGYLKAVSVGFEPVKLVSRYDRDPAQMRAALKEQGLPEDSPVRVIYQEQQQKELSACILGANPNAIARAYKNGVLTDADLEFFASEQARRETATMTDTPADVIAARQRAQTAFLVRYQQLIQAK